MILLLRAHLAAGLVFLLAAWMLAAPAQAARVSCKDWISGPEDLTTRGHSWNQSGMSMDDFFAHASEADVSLCLKAGASVNTWENGPSGPTISILHAAAGFSESPAVVEALLKAGADVDVRDQEGASPLHHAAMSVFPANVKILLQAGASVKGRTNNGKTPLHYAAGGTSSLEVVEALLEGGSDEWRLRSIMQGNRFNWTSPSQARDDDGHQPIHLAAMHSASPAVVKALLTSEQEILDERLLHLAAAYNDNPEVVKTLLDYGVNRADIVNAKDRSGDTPLHEAARISSSPEVVKILLDAGANVNARNTAGQTPLSKVEPGAGFNNFRSGGEEIAKILLDAGGDPEDLTGNFQYLLKSHNK